MLPGQGHYWDVNSAHHAGSRRPLHTILQARLQPQKCPGSDAGALNADSVGLLASDSVQPGLALFMLGKDDVDLRVSRDRNDHPTGCVQAHQF